MLSNRHGHRGFGGKLELLILGGNGLDTSKVVAQLGFFG